MKVTNVRSVYSYVSKGLLIGHGKTAFCYRLPDNRVLKLYVNTISKREYFDKYEDMVDHLALLSSVSNDSFVGPEEVLIKGDKVIGYIYPFVDGCTIKTMKSSTSLSSLYRNFNKLIEDTIEVGNNKFELIDVHNENILFDGDNYYVIDLDQGRLSKNDVDPVKHAINKNIREVQETIINTMFKGDNNYILSFSDYYLDELYRSVNWRDDKQIYDFFKALNDKCKSSDPTLGEVRHKVKTRMNFNEYKRPF